MTDLFNLTPAEVARIERKKRTMKNRRGRKNPSNLPDRLARTSAFAPRRQGLITDSNFSQTYVVPGYSVIEVKGRELGSQHRDAIYALFRMKPTTVYEDNPNYRKGTFILPMLPVCETKTTWRALLKAMDKTEHVNNLLTLMTVFQEIQQVSLIIHQGRSLEDMEKILKSRSQSRLADTPGSSEPMITKLSWSGAQLDSEVVVRYGQTVVEMIQKASLVSINAEIQFRLKSDHAKVFWPFIDSQPGHTWIDEERLAQLAGRQLWGEGATAAKRSQFRKECREAFKDMVAAKGLESYREEVTGSGWHKGRRWHYVHALPTQGELELLANKANEIAAKTSGAEADPPTPDAA
ncbi:hypothetical protein [Methylorubrum sp. SB2]|uniref:hypothetical protein n=1 Tax=Methylorubrum subtropicum TaxID=3138812 RepID=UPI00313EBA71